MKIVTSLNWVAGSLLLMLALFWPWIDQIFAKSRHAVVETTVQNLLHAQQQHHSIREDYILFDATDREMRAGFANLDMQAPADHTFIYEIFRGDDGAIMIRGRTSPAAIVREGLAPMTYTARIRPDGRAEEGKWSD